MARLATAEDTLQLSLMLKEMSLEMMPEYATDDDDIYWKEVFSWLEDDRTFVYIDDAYRGFFVMIDDTEDIFPDYHRYLGTKIYIKPQHRKTRLYSQFFKKMLEDFNDGDIMGVTEIESDHIPVLEKRHKRIANVYLINR